jgi:hypothetical protein
MARRRQVGRTAPVPADTDGAPFEPVGPLEQLIADAIAHRVNGAPITPEELPTVVACRNAYADALRQLPIVAMRGRRPRPDQPSVYLQPDPDEPRGRTLERIAYQLTGPGYCWLMITIPAPLGGFAGAVRLLDAAQAHVAEQDAFGRPTLVTDLTGTQHVPGQSIVRITAAMVAAGDLGRSPLQQCTAAMDALCNLYAMCSSFWEAGFPSIALAVEHRLTRAQATELKENVIGAWSRRHEPAVIDNGATLQPVGSNAVEAQLVESIKVADQSIARAYGIPASIVNIESGGSLTYSTTEGEKRAWIALGLGSLLSRVEEAFSVLGPHGTEARLDTDEWLRADNEARARFYTAATAGQPWMLPDEVRDREGLEPLGGSAPAPAPASASTTAPASVPVPSPTPENVP